jgi:hypothetical protein
MERWTVQITTARIGTVKCYCRGVTTSSTLCVAVSDLDLELQYSDETVCETCYFFCKRLDVITAVLIKWVSCPATNGCSNLFDLFWGFWIFNSCDFVVWNHDCSKCALILFFILSSCINSRNSNIYLFENRNEQKHFPLLKYKTSRNI